MGGSLGKPYSNYYISSCYLSLPPPLSRSLVLLRFLLSKLGIFYVMVVDFLIASSPSTIMQHTPMFAYKVSRNNCVFSNSLARREVLISTLLCPSVRKLLLGAFICNYIKFWSSYLCTLAKYMKGISTPRRESHLQNNR